MTRKENIRTILECYFTGFKDVLIDSACERICELEQPRQTGKWIVHLGGGIWVNYYECSECGQGHNTHSDYCPNCGAKMESEVNNG